MIKKKKRKTKKKTVKKITQTELVTPQCGKSPTSAIPTVGNAHHPLKPYDYKPTKEDFYVHAILSGTNTMQIHGKDLYRHVLDNARRMIDYQEKN